MFGTVFIFPNPMADLQKVNVYILTTFSHAIRVLLASKSNKELSYTFEINSLCALAEYI